jgi:Peptide-N-glycosidase F, C terminal
MSACSSDESSNAPSSPAPEAGVDVIQDVSNDDVAPDAPLDVAQDQMDGQPDAGEDTGSDVDAGPDAAATWEGPPWYGCTANDEPASATVVSAFDLADQYFNPEDLRTIEAQVDFPSAGSWERIDMIVELSCPADGDCDNWDRFANVMLVEDPGGANEEVLELERYMTPYNRGMCMRTDVTRFAPRLNGTKTIRSFIDTWVGPNESVHGHGWRTTVKFVFHPGTPDQNAVPESLIALWPFDSVEIGNPDAPFADTMGSKTVAIPAGTSRAELRVVATGHGQGNRSNCAEFCPMTHELTVNGTAFSFDPWRDDCADNPIGPGQAGTWKYNRAGWCPGAYSLPEVLDITSAVVSGQDATITYDVLTSAQGVYENLCRPGAGDANNHCTHCAFDNDPGNCEYNGGNHTPPVEKIAVQLLLYK